MGIGGYIYKEKISVPNQQIQGDVEIVDVGGAETLVNNFGKKVLSVNELAKKLGPSCVGIINKAEVQPHHP